MENKFNSEWQGVQNTLRWRTVLNQLELAILILTDPSGDPQEDFNKIIYVTEMLLNEINFEAINKDGNKKRILEKKLHRLVTAHRTYHYKKRTGQLRFYSETNKGKRKGKQ